MPIIDALLKASIKILQKTQKARKRKAKQKKLAKKRKAVRKHATKKKARPKATKKKAVRKKVKKATSKKKPKKAVKAKPKKKVKKKAKKKVKKAVKKKASSKKKPVKKVKESKPDGILVGEITHYFSKIKVCVVHLTKGGLIVGEHVLITGKSTNFKQSVSSMQIESVDVKVAKKGSLIGVKTVKPAKVGDRVFKLK